MINLELLKGLTLLYVEDESALQESIRHNLSLFVREIIVASDGAEGLALFRQHRERINLIISDILMPHMNGIEMVDAIRKIDQEVPIIYTTAFDESRYLKHAIAQSVDSYILKPVDIEKLMNGIKKALLKIENNRLRESLQEANFSLSEKVEQKTEQLIEKNRELHRQLYTDELTELPNRKALRDDLRNAPHPVLLLIDLDNFRAYNDLYGEKIGNKILKQVADVIQSHAQTFSFVSYRMSADLFALLKDDCPGLDAMTRESDYLIKTITNFTISAYDMTFSIGATLGLVDGSDDLIARASMALKYAKSHNIPYKFYDEACDLGSQYQHDIAWSKVLQQAIRERRVAMHHQPILDRDRHIVKYESLMRIQIEERLYSPYAFLNVAKKAKLYSQLTKIAIESALDNARQFGCNIAINLSMEDIENPAAIDTIIHKVAQSKIGHLITFEILESENIHDYDQVLYFVQKARQIGCSIAIDDFGSGYSNFAYLLRIKPDFLKIDGSLVKNITQDTFAHIITKAITGFAHDLGIKVVAEYVHSQEIFDLLLEMGVDQFQGFYLGEPEAEIKHLGCIRPKFDTREEMK